MHTEEREEWAFFRADEQAPEGLSPPRRAWSAAGASSTATRSWWRSWAATTSAPARPPGRSRSAAGRRAGFDGV